MLRFRPIAPKPAPHGPPPSTAALHQKIVSDAVAAENGNKRVKRKYVRVCQRGRPQRRRAKDGKIEEIVSRATSSGDGSAVDDRSSPEDEKLLVTLQLLPHVGCNNKRHRRDDIIQPPPKVSLTHDVAAVKSQRAAESLGKDLMVVVECVTEYKKLGFSSFVSDRDRIKSLEGDTCPGFVSDGGNNVVWVNGAYRKMLESRLFDNGNKDEEENNGTFINHINGNNPRLVVKERLPQFCPSFACRVALILRTEGGQKWKRIVHCDVSRMMEEFVGFAWRLDLSTSIGLGFS